MGQRWAWRSVRRSPPDDEAVFPDLDGDDPRTIKHQLCDGYDPAQYKLDLRFLSWP